MIFDNFNGVNIVNSVLYKLFSLQERILLIKNIYVFFGVDLLWLTRVL